MSSKSKVWIELALLILTLCVFSACKRPSAPAAPLENSPGGWSLANNQRAKLSDYRGKVVVLDFYATWCEPCRAETPHLVNMQKQYEPQGLQVVGLNVGGEDDRGEVPKYAKEFGIQYPLGFPDDEFADHYLSDNQNIPQAFVFDRSGRLVKRFVGYNEEGGRELERVVQVSLSQAQ
ncbi:MAG TPA: redoxin domain-containing protein [Pyrinomonadaceae bacterium]|nr:redoxin domain-containing protein [Pyrinomonadaceae bacterium]